MTPKNLMQLCRLCLMEDKVKISIFEEQGAGEVKQIFLKISSCLPVTISQTDELPKKICVQCSLKLDSFYQFWNDTIKAEKQLNLWLTDIKSDSTEINVRHCRKQVGKNLINYNNNNNNKAVDGGEIKEETIDSEEERLINKLKNFGEYDTHTKECYLENSHENPSLVPAKRAKRACTMRQIIQAEAEYNDDEIEEIAEMRDKSDESEEEGNGIFSGSPSPIHIEDQPSTSGLEDALNSQNENHLVPIIQLSEGDWMHNEDITSPFAAQMHTTLKKLGYKNPFVYPELKNKKKSLKKIESKNNTKWQCMICSDVKMDKKELMEHYESHKSETETIKGSKLLGDYFMCPVCLTDFTSLISYEKHVELHHSEKQYNCEECHRAFKNLYSLSVHNHKRHGVEKIFKCAGCDFEDNELKSLRSHIRTFHEEHVKYRCEICNKGFSSLSWYHEHKNFHTGAMPFECEVCLKSFPYTRYLIAHKKNMHPEMFSSLPINHECDICQKKFAHKKSLVLHLRAHTGESAVLCDMCGKSLSSSEHLKQHLRIHTGYKPHCCSVCGKGFAKKCNLTLHERVHSGEKPHICNVCGKGFSQRSTLVIHGRYHSGERPYRCQLCQKGFVAKGLLGVHMKTCIGISD